MLIIHSLIQKVYGFVKCISKKSYRDCAVIITGTVVVALIALNSSNFNGAGKNKVVLNSEVKVQQINEKEMEEKKVGMVLEQILFITQMEVEMLPETPIVSEIATLPVTFITSEVAIPPQMPIESEVAMPPEVSIVSDVAMPPEVPIVSEVAPPEVPIVSEEALIPDVSQVEEVIAVPQISLPADDYEALTRIVEAEAGGEDEKGKILVANVIFNRINHSEFPDTVKEVVFQKSGGSAQFSPTVDGRYYSIQVSEDTKDAVEKVLSGIDESQGALFFSARSQANPNDMSWFDRNLNWLYKHGGHEFYTLK